VTSRSLCSQRDADVDNANDDVDDDAAAAADRDDLEPLRAATSCEAGRRTACFTSRVASMVAGLLLQCQPPVDVPWSTRPDVSRLAVYGVSGIEYNPRPDSQIQRMCSIRDSGDRPLLRTAPPPPPLTRAAPNTLLRRAEPRCQGSLAWFVLILLHKYGE
jgi:hypothetical protein